MQEAMASKSLKREPEVSPEICKLKEEFEQEKKKMEEERLAMLQTQQVKDQANQEKMEMMMGHASQRHQELLDETMKRNEMLLKESNAKHQELLEVNNMAYQSHVEQLQHQVCWLTTLVSPDKIQEVMNDPQRYAETSAQASQLRQEMGASTFSPQ